MIRTVSIILNNKDIEKYGQNFNYDKKYSLQKKYFLICGGCFWMASTLPPSLDYPLIRYKKCPICKNNVDNFQIPNQYRQVM
jgi:rubrerythrin